MNYIAQNLKVLRKQFSLSQEGLAEHIGNKRHNISAWEDGRAQPSIEDLIRIANYFNIGLNDLLRTEIDANFFITAKEMPPVYEAVDHKTCISLIQYLESELKSKNEIIKSLIDLLKSK
jgi:DNA-binding XRE family transcriptional regulator